jgi:hypothetical protein
VTGVGLKLEMGSGITNLLVHTVKTALTLVSPRSDPLNFGGGSTRCPHYHSPVRGMRSPLMTHCLDSSSTICLFPAQASVDARREGRRNDCARPHLRPNPSCHTWLSGPKNQRWIMLDFCFLIPNS